MRILVLGILAGCDGGGDGGSSPEQDADGDGYAPPEDCDDADEGVHPGAADDWYDGVDHDCAGNDDYDKDGDGHASDLFEGDDCVDANADISPSAPEVHYDGVDNDCDPATADTDPDGDGFLPPEDCDDADPDAWPGAAERLGDASDGDCNGDPDTAELAYGDLNWNLPSSPRLARTGGHVVLGVTASSVDGGAKALSATNPAVLMVFDPAVRGAVEPVYGPDLYFQGEPLGEIDLVAAGPDLWAAVTYFSETNQYGWLTMQELLWVPGVGYVLGQVSSLSSVLTDFHRVDVTLDSSGVPWGCTSDDDAIAYVRGDVPFPSPGGVLLGADGAATCFFEPGGTAPLSFTTCDAAGACTTWDTDPDGSDPTPVASASQPRAGERWLAARERDGVLTVVPEGGGVLVIDGAQSYDVLAGRTIDDAEAVLDSGGELWLAVAEGGELVLAHGDPGGTLEEIVFPLVRDGLQLDATGVALWVEDDLVVLAVSAAEKGSDSVGWVLLER